MNDLDKIFNEAQEIVLSGKKVDVEDDGAVSVEEFRPEEQLVPANYEEFVFDVAQGSDPVDAYRRHINTKQPMRGAKNVANKFMKKPRVKLRLEYLQSQWSGGKGQGSVDNEEIKARLSYVIRHGADSHRIHAIGKLQAILEKEQAAKEGEVVARPDPAFVMEYLCGYAGYEPKDYVRDLGGLGEILKSIKELCGVTNEDICSALNVSGETINQTNGCDREITHE